MRSSRSFSGTSREHLREVRKRLGETEKEEPIGVSARGSGESLPQHAAREECTPETVPELQEALRTARLEAARWKRAYQQYHRITHGN